VKKKSISMMGEGAGSVAEFELQVSFDRRPF